MWSVLRNYSDAALLFLRVTLGSFYIYVHGWPKLAGGAPRWKEVGLAVHHVGIHFAPAFWGFLAASTETLGMLLFIIGLFFRPACLAVAMLLAVATAFHFGTTKGGFYAEALEASHAVELMLVFIALIFIGPGKFSVDKG